MIAISEEFLSGMVAALLCFLVGAFVAFVWMLYRPMHNDSPPDDDGGDSWDDDDPLYPPSNWSEFEDERWEYK